MILGWACLTFVFISDFIFINHGIGAHADRISPSDKKIAQKVQPPPLLGCDPLFRPTYKPLLNGPFPCSGSFSQASATPSQPHPSKPPSACSSSASPQTPALSTPGSSTATSSWLASAPSCASSHIRYAASRLQRHGIRSWALVRPRHCSLIPRISSARRVS